MSDETVPGPADASIEAQAAHRTIKPCCRGMASLLDRRGKHGFSADINWPETTGPYLMIHYSAYDEDQHQAVVDAFKQAPSSISLKLGGWLPIRCCPWCGYRMWKMLAGVEKGFFRRLLDKIRSYSTD